EVAEDVGATEAGDALASVHVAAGDCARAGHMRVLVDRGDRASGLRAVETVVAFHAGPAVVLSAGRRAQLEVDLFPVVLADVADPEVAGGGVEREAPRVAEAPGPDLGTGAALADERVGRRDGVRLAGRRLGVDAEDLPEQHALVLRVVARVAIAASVAHADVEVAVGAEGE